MSQLIPHSQNNTSYFTVPKHVSSRKQLHHDRHSLSHRHNTSQVMFTKFRINRQRNDINDTQLIKGKHQGKIGYDNKTTGRIQSHLMVLVTQIQRFYISVTARNTFITVKLMLGGPWGLTSTSLASGDSCVCQTCTQLTSQHYSSCSGLSMYFISPNRRCMIVGKRLMIQIRLNLPISVLTY